MSGPAENRKQDIPFAFWALVIGFLLLAIFSSVLESIDTTTELFPYHESLYQSCTIITCSCVLIAFSIAIYLTRRLPVVQRIILPLLLAFEAALGVFMVTWHLAAIKAGREDFPAGKTKTQAVQIAISRAYQVHGKGISQSIQTMPIWSDLSITEQDFDFMRSNRPPGDEGKNPNEISSRGYFCVNVNIEYTDKAVRILNAGTKKLPAGTVTRCAAPLWR